MHSKRSPRCRLSCKAHSGLPRARFELARCRSCPSCWQPGTVRTAGSKGQEAGRACRTYAQARILSRPRTQGIILLVGILPPGSSCSSRTAVTTGVLSSIAPIHLG